MIDVMMMMELLTHAAVDVRDQGKARSIGCLHTDREGDHQDDGRVVGGGLGEPDEEDALEKDKHELDNDTTLDTIPFVGKVAEEATVVRGMRRRGG